MLSKDQLIHRIKKSKRYCIACAIKLAREKAYRPSDANICESIVQQFDKNRNVSANQLSLLQKVLPSYVDSIINVGGLSHDDVFMAGERISILEGSSLILKFPLNIELIKTVKYTIGATWDNKEKCWFKKPTVEIIDVLSEQHGFEIHENVSEWYQKAIAPIDLSQHIDIPGLQLTLFEYQRQGVNFIEHKEGCALVADDMGLGKAQPIECNILTPSGYRKIKDCKVGDALFGTDGKIYKIQGIYPQGIKEVYEVTFSDKTSTLCCKDHLWEFTTPSDLYMKRKNRVRPLEFFFGKKLKWKNGNNYFIPMTSPLEFKKQNVCLDPYLIGALLGDGILANDTIGFANVDTDVLSEVEKLLPENIMLKKEINSDVNHSLVWNYKTQNLNPIRTEIVRLGINKESSEKFIPDVYKYNDIESRISLLQGLLDTDGYAAKDCIQYTSTSERLCDDVQFIIESLGGYGKKSSEIPDYTYNEERRKGKRAYTLTLKLPNYIVPFRCQRKINRVSAKKRINPTRAIISIEKVNSSECACIKTTAPNSLYLTNNCIVTHNTAQALAWLQLHPELRPAIIMCPSTLKYNWAKECIKWMDNPNVYVINGRYNKNFSIEDFSYKSSKNGKIFIVNYDIISNSTEKYIDDDGKQKKKFLKNTGWESYFKGKAKVLVLDEVHYLKNPDSHRTKAVNKVARSTDHVIGLTGTPIVNRPIEIFNVLKLINPQIFPSFFKFAQKYCDAKHNGFGWEYSGAINTKELHDILSREIMIRRLKKDVLKQLQEKTKIVIPLELTDKSSYIQASENFLDWVHDNFDFEKAQKAENAQALTKLALLKQLILDQKLDQCIQWISNFLETGEKLVVFATHQKVIHRLMKLYKEFEKEKDGIAVKIDGSLNAIQKQHAVDLFVQYPQCRLCVGNIKAAGTGVDGLQKVCSNAAFLELPWTPGDLEQTEDRIHRIGQNDGAMIYYLLCQDTIEEDILEMLSDKSKILNSVLDGNDITDDTSITALLKNLTKKRSFGL